MNMKEILQRIQARIDEINEGGAGTSERAISMAATGSPDTIRNWRRGAESGKPRGATITKISQVAEALEVSPDWLLTGENPPQTPHSQLISDIVDLLYELEPEELRMMRATARGYRAQRHEDTK